MKKCLQVEKDVLLRGTESDSMLREFDLARKCVQITSCMSDLNFILRKFMSAYCGKSIMWKLPHFSASNEISFKLLSHKKLSSRKISEFPCYAYTFISKSTSILIIRCHG